MNPWCRKHRRRGGRRRPSYRCICTEGFSGSRCQFGPGVCDSHPCSDGSVCKEVVGGKGYACRSIHFTQPLIGEWAEYCDARVCLSVRLFVYPRSYLRNYTSHLHETVCILPMCVARFFSGGVAICYVLSVLWMTSCLYIMARNRRREWLNKEQHGFNTVACTQTSPQEGSTWLGAEFNIYYFLVE